MQKMEFRTFSNWYEKCKHENKVDDDREGHVVCTDCGLVFEPIYQNLIVNYDKNNVFRHINKEKEIVTTSLEAPKIHYNLENETNELDILCNKLQLYSVTKTQVFERWELTKKWFRDKKMKDRKKLSYRKGLIVMPIYHTLIDLDIPRPMSHLCQDAGIVPKYVWYWIKLYHKTRTKEDKVSILKPSSMSEYFLKPLNLSFKEIEEIKKIVEENDVLTFAPKTLLTSCAYIFLRNKNKQSPSVKKIANVLGVSVMSVYRCVAALKYNEQGKN